MRPSKERGGRATTAHRAPASASPSRHDAYGVDLRLVPRLGADAWTSRTRTGRKKCRPPSAIQDLSIHGETRRTSHSQRRRGRLRTLYRTPPPARFHRGRSSTSGETRSLLVLRTFDVARHLLPRPWGGRASAPPRPACRRAPTSTTRAPGSWHLSRAVHSIDGLRRPSVCPSSPGPCRQ